MDGHHQTPVRQRSMDSHPNLWHVFAAKELASSVPHGPNGPQWCLEDPGSTIGYPLLPAKNMLKICIFEHDLTISYCVSLSQVPRSSHIVTHWLPTVTATKGPPSHFRVPKDAGKSEMLMLWHAVMIDALWLTLNPVSVSGNGGFLVSLNSSTSWEFHMLHIVNCSI